MRTLLLIFALIIGLLSPTTAARLNDKLENRPYADLRRWHLGFGIGLHTQDIQFTHNGLVPEAVELPGGTWYAEQPSFSPGFSVNGLFDLRLSKHFSLRFTPGLYFGNRDVHLNLIDPTTGSVARTERQNLKSTFIVTPIDIKFAAQRFRNSRPYLTAGVMPAFDVTKKTGDFLRLKTFDTYLTVGLGCDFYLPFFKLNPEIKFCFGLTDIIDHKRTDLVDDPQHLQVTQAITKATSQMVVLTFFFE